MLKRFIFIFYFIKINFIVLSLSQNPEFVQLIGYSIIADVSETIASNNIFECAQNCLDSATTMPCVGVQFDYINCKLFTSIRNIIENATACDNYVFDRRNSTAGDLGLSETDQLVYFNAYLNESSSCSQGATKMLYGCEITIDESKCLEYAAFFNAVVSPDNTECIFNPIQSNCYQYPTTDGPWMYSDTATSIDYCYFNASVPINQTIDYYSGKCKDISSKSNLISFCDVEEGNFIQNSGWTLPIMIGLYNFANPWRNDSYTWIDGNTCPYRKWANTEPNGGSYGAQIERFVGNQGIWYDFYTWRFPTLFCKEVSYNFTEFYDFCKSGNDCFVE